MASIEKAENSFSQKIVKFMTCSFKIKSSNGSDTRKATLKKKASMRYQIDEEEDNFEAPINSDYESDGDYQFSLPKAVSEAKISIDETLKGLE